MWKSTDNFRNTILLLEGDFITEELFFPVVYCPMSMLLAEVKAAFTHLCCYYSGLLDRFTSRHAHFLLQPMLDGPHRRFIQQRCEATFQFVGRNEWITSRRMILSVAGVVILGLPERGRGAVEPVSW